MTGQTNTNLIKFLATCLVCLLIGVTKGPAQVAIKTADIQETDIPAADLAKVELLQDISQHTFIYFSDQRELTPWQISSLPFTVQGTRSYGHFIPASLINKLVILRMRLENSSDTIQQVWLCPGFFFTRIDLYKRSDPPLPSISNPGTTVTSNSPLLPYPAAQPDDPDSAGYRKITLQAHEQATFYVALTFIKSPTNSINPTLTRENFIRQAISLNHKSKTNIDIITNLFAGIMLMMIFYAISEYLQTGKVEFLYYVGYAACISSLLFLKGVMHNSATAFNYLFESFWDNLIFSGGHVFYMLFHRKFLETRKHYPYLDKLLHGGAIVISIFMGLYVICYFVSPDFRVTNYLEDATKILLLVILLIFIIKGLGYRKQLMNYIVWGNISLFVLSIISQLMISANIKPIKGASVLNQALFYYELGITIEVLFFLFAVSYKNKMEIISSIQKEEKLKLETERKELEKQVAVLAAKQDERNRISIDMHDELGSGVTAIRLMSEIVKSKMKEQTLPEIEKISNSANELLNKMNTIIWTMTSSNDTVENLIAYIRSFAVEFFENTTIDCYFNMPSTIPSREITGEKRRNIFLCVKEALNNVLKHSQCSTVRINVLVNDSLIIEIQDDGVGINMEKLRKFGNGLHNMKKRMDSIQGTSCIENLNGTRTTFSLIL